MRLLCVEGHMLRVSHLLATAGRGSIEKNDNFLPSLREQFIEVWPRDPTREDRDNGAWGEQTLGLLTTLGELGGRVVRVVGFRLEGDWGRFEREYVGVRGWRRRRRMVEVGGKGEGDEMNYYTTCGKLYELKG